MGWLGLDGIEDSEAERLERARAVQAYARKVLAAYQRGDWDPRKAAHAANMLDGLDDEGAFSPAQQAALGRLAEQLRAYARAAVEGHQRRFHRRKRPVARALPPPQRPVRVTDVPISGWEPDRGDDELGFLPALAPILGAVAPMLGGLFGGGGDKEPAPAAAPAPQVLPTGATNVTLPAIGGVIADQIRAVPANVRQQVNDALRESLDRYKSGQNDARKLMEDIAKNLGPSINKQLAAVNEAALQRQATYEHNVLVDRDKRWKANSETQKAILARLAKMERSLGNAVVGQKRRTNAVARAFGVPPGLR